MIIGPPRPAADREVRQQDQHELRVQQRRGGRAGGAYLVPVVAGLYNQVRAAGAQETHATEGEHETQSAPRGLLLLDLSLCDSRGCPGLVFGEQWSSDHTAITE